MAAVPEYIVAEELELAGNAVEDNREMRLIPFHIQLAVRNDDELNFLFYRHILREQMNTTDGSNPSDVGWTVSVNELNEMTTFFTMMIVSCPMQYDDHQ